MTPYEINLAIEVEKDKIPCIHEKMYYINENDKEYEIGLMIEVLQDRIAELEALRDALQVG